MNTVEQWLHFFEQVSCFYREMYMFPIWRKYPNHTIDIWDSLAIFLEGYAFERQGRRPDYFHAGVDALLYCKQQNDGNMKQNIVNDIWKQFSQLLDNQGLNKKNNPLYPRQNPQQKCSLIEVVLSEKIIQQKQTFTTYLQTLISKDNNIRDAFKLVKSIRGVGDKIAPFFLRDLVDVMNIALTTETRNRNLLQPIDIWIGRTVKILTDNQRMSGNQVANWIVDTSMQHNVNPECVNIGIWFFCSNIIESEYRLNIMLNNIKDAKNLANSFKIRIRNTHQNCVNFTKPDNW